MVQSATKGGIGLTELWNNNAVRELIHSRHWDYIVLQEQSFWAMSYPGVHMTTAAAQHFDEEIKKVHAHTLLFTTWPRKPGSKWYTDPKYAFLENPRYMLQRFDAQTQELATRLGAVAIPVGDFWFRALTQLPGMELYASDGTHPSPAGTYLAALVFYRYLGGHSLGQIAYAPSAVTPQQADALHRLIAW